MMQASLGEKTLCDKQDQLKTQNHKKYAY